MLTAEEILAYQERAYHNGRCVQCVNPWFDGLCECGELTVEQNEETDLVLTSAVSLWGRDFPPSAYTP